MRAQAKKNAAPHSGIATRGGLLVQLNEKVFERARDIVARNAALGKIYERLLVVVAETALEEAKRRYEIGRMVRPVMEEEKKYGKRSVEALATLLGFDKSTLHDYAKVAKTWEASEFGALLKRKTPAGLGLRFSHFVVIAEVGDDRRRKTLLAQTITQSLTVRHLKELVHPSGKPDAAPKQATTPADRIRHVAARWELVVDDIDRETRELVHLVTSSPEVLGLVQAAAAKQRALANKAVACAVQLEGLARGGF